VTRNDEIQISEIKKKRYMKTEWRIKASDILAAVAIVVSLFALFVSFKQLWLQEGQYESQKKENQPIFDVTTYYDKVKQDSINDTEILSIKNIGREAQSMGIILCETFIKFEERYYQDRQTLYIPIIDYFASHADQPGLIGEVITDITEGNYLEFKRFCDECEWNSLSLNRFTCQLVNFVKITYTDIYEDEHTVYFENGQKCSKDYYEEIVKKSREDFHETYFKMCDLHFDDLKKYCKIRKNYKKGR